MTTPSTLRSRHSTTRGACRCWCRDPVFGTAISTGKQASSDASAAATNSQRIPDVPTKPPMNGPIASPTVRDPKSVP